ncbi:hypothetical protein GGR56DRAFT_688100 [Xylariaceae sp. FL0804]|nr:hypothetical protein GGR56DRAFT_688100 [Xylariaceae sp. FL0804]
MSATVTNETTAPPSTLPSTLTTGKDVRLYARSQQECSVTSGLAPSYLQANLLILPSRYADDFRLLCARNPVPCPLIGESAGPGRWDAVRSCLPGVDGPRMASDVDIRRDAPRYNVYDGSTLAKAGCADVVAEWTPDHVAFLIGCSFSFETALTAAGLPPLHTAQRRNVPMYRTQLRLCPAGVFEGATCVVSMRAYRRRDVEAVRRVTRAYVATHGEPVAWGWDGARDLGIRDVDVPQWGDAPLTADGRPLGELERSRGAGGGGGDGDGDDDDELVPVFWGCGVTPQEAVMRADLEGTIMAHSPGHMLLLDCQDHDILGS